MMIIRNLQEVSHRDWLDYSSLSTYCRCPRQYYWRYIQHLAPDREAIALLNGSAYHDCKAEYYTRKAQGATHEEAIEFAIQVLQKGMSLITEPDETRNFTIANETMRNYFHQWQHEQYQTVEVEVPFGIDFGPFIYAGKRDRIVDSDFGRLVEETKTTSIIGKRWHLRLDPNMQIDGYVASTYIESGVMPYGAVLDVIPVTKDPNKKGNEPFRFITPRSLEQVDTWVQDVQSWWDRIAEDKESHAFPRNTDACAPLVGFSCDFMTICAKYSNVRGLELAEVPGDYKIEKWAPFEELLKHA